jgi:hypothetical protein
MLKKWFYILILTAGVSSCYYDNEEELYPRDPNACDTVNVTYSKTVLPMLQNQCYVCHSEAAAQGNVVLEGYDKVRTEVENGRFFGAINHAQGFTPMPYNMPKLPECTIKQMKAWIAAGALNN